MGDWYVSPISRMDPELHDALYKDACSILLAEETIWVSPEEDYADCAAAFNGALARSYYSVIMKYIDMATTTINDIPMDVGVTLPEIFATTRFLPHLEAMTSFENPQFRNITSEMNHHVLHNINTNLDGSLVKMKNVSVTFVVVFAVFAAFIYLPMVRSSGRHVAMSEAILLMFDDKQLSEVSHLKVAVRTILQHATGQASNLAIIDLALVCWSSITAWISRVRRRTAQSAAKTRRTSFQEPTNQ